MHLTIQTAGSVDENSRCIPHVSFGDVPGQAEAAGPAAVHHATVSGKLKIDNNSCIYGTGLLKIDMPTHANKIYKFNTFYWYSKKKNMWRAINSWGRRVTVSAMSCFT